MPIPTYTSGYPPDGSSLGQTKSVIRNNLDGTFQTLNVDHINNNGSPGSQPAGYHTIVHQVPQTSVNTLAGYNQVFSGVPGSLVVNSSTTDAIPPGGDKQLYSLSPAGELSQLTGHVALTNGYQWIGGVLIQWGVTGTSSSNINVSFPTSNVSFPNNCFNVQVTAIRASGGSFTTNFSVTSVSTGGFTIVNANSSATSLSYYWVAIGN